MREEGWGHGQHVLVLCRTRGSLVARRAGAAAGATLVVGPAQEQQQPSHPGQRGRANLTDSGSLCSHKPSADPTDQSPSKGGAHYQHHVAAVERRRQAGAVSIPSRLQVWMLRILLLWQCLGYMEWKHRSQ